jgi:uncharacterized LabA/DUF88 family protein
MEALFSPMKTALLIDGAFLRKKFRSALKRDLGASDVRAFVDSIFPKLGLSSESHRAYFYDCPPCDEKTSLPISHSAYEFEATPQYRKGAKLLDDIKRLPFFAVREGALSFNGWTLKPSCYGKTPLTDDCFSPNLKQKGVDIKIGLDVAWVSFDHVAEQIVMVTGDSDFIPVIKTARRNGVFVYLLTLGHNVKPDLSANVDVVNEDKIGTFLPNP